MKFKEISEAYASYVRKNYGNAYIVFDGYDEAISTKSNAHANKVERNLKVHHKM